MNVIATFPEPGLEVITIQRPDRSNAVDSGTAAELVRAFLDFDANAAVNVAILQGSGHVFCAGADLKAMAAGERNPVAEQGHGPMGPTRMLLSKPVIAAIEGAAVAGGLELAIWADMRVAGETAVFGVYCRRFGVPLVDLGTIRLPRLIGHGRAMDMILTGRAVLADEALRIGLVDRLVPAGTALQSALVLAREISSYPQICMRNDRMSAITQWNMTWEDALRQECRLGMNSIASGEAFQGAARFASGQGRHGDGVPR